LLEFYRLSGSFWKFFLPHSSANERWLWCNLGIENAVPR
jgi:hypothetical protein